MHIIDGVLSLPVLVTGGVLAVAGTFMGLRRMELEHIP
ncbi:MAG TPA: cobalamin biosynthesis protein CbiM, partial [Magnetococcales bacterium]|nr:cobalamin biosynthesis protein CbiM [Magnetococcales bacterium]